MPQMQTEIERFKMGYELTVGLWDSWKKSSHHPGSHQILVEREDDNCPVISVLECEEKERSRALWRDAAATVQVLRLQEKLMNLTRELVVSQAICWVL